jgi:hypothetical protein
VESHLREQPHTIWEQAAFNELLRKGIRYGGPAAKQVVANASHPYANRLVGTYTGGSILTGVLPVSTFCSGHTAFAQRMPQVLGKRPYALHTDFLEGTNGKRHRLREWSVWADPPAYYDPPQGLIAVELVPPERLLRPGGQPPSTLEHHLRSPIGSSRAFARPSSSPS